MKRYLLDFLVLVWLTTMANLATIEAQDAGAHEPADLVIAGGHIKTMDPDKPTAQWLAVTGDRISAIGDGTSYTAWVGENTRLIKLDSAFVTPGWIDSHGHFTSLGESKLILDLTHVHSWDEIVAKVAAEVKKSHPGQLIRGRGWHQEKWDSPPEPNIDGLPTDESLSAVSPNNPVILTHASGHMCFANAYAMRLASIDATTQNPSGGEIVRLSDNRPSGAFRETAQGLLAPVKSADANSLTPQQRLARLNRVVDLATEECLRNGITSFDDASSDFDTIDFFKQRADEGRLDVHLYVMVHDSIQRMTRRLASTRMVGYGHNFLTVRAIKMFCDGALGSHGAWLLAPYDDMPTSTGLNTTPIEEIEQAAQLAIENNYQLCVHAIGDRANRTVLDIYEKAFKAHPSDSSRRWRVEHAQHLDPADISRFSQLGVIASMQGIHCTSDAIFVVHRLGTRRAKEGAYAWQSLLKSGAVICNGTDVPVEPIDPISCYYASVTRKSKEGVAFFPEQCMTREQALRSYTVSGAYAAFEEDLKGSLTVGKLADITVWSKNLLTCPDDQIRDTKPLYTIVAGKIKFSATE